LHKEEYDTKRLANIMLGVWLIFRGLISLTDFNFQNSATFLSIVAIAAGALLILADRAEKFSAHIADIVLGSWLILAGIIPLFSLSFRGSHAVIEMIAILAGVLIILRRR
jgi:hypothetical protein